MHKVPRSQKPRVVAYIERDIFDAFMTLVRKESRTQTAIVDRALRMYIAEAKKAETAMKRSA